MVNSVVYLPDGQSFTVVPVFAGLLFKSNDLNAHHSAYPVGWTVVLHTEDEQKPEADAATDATAKTDEKPHVHSFRKPTLLGDSLFISSVSAPSASEYKPAASPTRQSAMMLWVTLYWYFQQQAPDILLPATAASNGTPVGGRPRGDWRIRIKREGLFRTRNLLPKLERMGLVASPDTSSGRDESENGGSWDNLFMTRSMFWQIPPQLFLFTLQPATKATASIAGVGGIGGTSSYPGSPSGSRPGSPIPADGEPKALASVQSFPIGPFFSTSHLPTYYPPGPLRYTMTNNVRHPARPKPPRQGEVFYSRFVPSANQYLSLRVASLSPQAVPYLGPKGPQDPIAEAATLTALSDTDLMKKWFSSPRVSKFWGNWEDNFLEVGLSSQHSFPVIAMWDGVPFGYFEIYWVKEDILGVLVGAPTDDFDRGLHVFIGEEWARGRVQQWLSSIVQYILTSDYRTQSVCIEPRVDNTRFIQLLEAGGFNKQREVTFKHKQSWFGRLDRDGWQGPAL